jgi:hypothetical protein
VGTTRAVGLRQLRDFGSRGTALERALEDARGGERHREGGTQHGGEYEAAAAPAEAPAGPAGAPSSTPPDNGSEPANEPANDRAAAPAADAERIGLVSAVFPDGRLLDEVQLRAARLAANDAQGQDWLSGTQRACAGAYLAWAQGDLGEACARWRQMLDLEVRSDLYGQIVEARLRLADALRCRGRPPGEAAAVRAHRSTAACRSGAEDGARKCSPPPDGTAGRGSARRTARRLSRRRRRSALEPTSGS